MSKIKTIGLWILAVLGTIVLLGYPIIISSFGLEWSRIIIRIGLYIATGVTAIGLVWLVVSRIVKAIKNKKKQTSKKTPSEEAIDRIVKRIKRG